MAPFLRGWSGELLTRFAMWIWLDSSTYRRAHNLIVPCRDGTTQIDHLLVSIYGLFVLETKNMRGWIFGNAHAPQWTQSIYGKMYRFQNPLHQNYRHVRALAEYLELSESVIRPIVFFIGECEFKTEIPPGVLTRGLCSYIRSFREPVLTPGKVDSIAAELLRVKGKPAASHAMHVAGLRERHHGDTCPKCGSALALRTARRGPGAGQSFYGCSAYPRCRYTRPL